MCPQTSRRCDFFFLPSNRQRSCLTPCTQQHKDNRPSYREDKGVSSYFIIYSAIHCQVSASVVSTRKEVNSKLPSLETAPRIMSFNVYPLGDLPSASSHHERGERGWKWVSACPLKSKPISYTVFPSPAITNS